MALSLISTSFLACVKGLSLNVERYFISVPTCTSLLSDIVNPLGRWVAYTSAASSSIRYKDLARDVVRSIVKRKAKYHEYEGPPPLENLEDFVHFCRVIEAKHM